MSDRLDEDRPPLVKSHRSVREGIAVAARSAPLECRPGPARLRPISAEELTAGALGVGRVFYM